MTILLNCGLLHVDICAYVPLPLTCIIFCDSCECGSSALRKTTHGEWYKEYKRKITVCA